VSISPDSGERPQPHETQDAVTLNDVPPTNPTNAATIGSDGPPVPVSVPQKRIFGDYELIREIARGGMGVVFEARQVSLNRTVALKMILSGHLASAGDVQRFRVEAEAAGHLDHPHIVPIYDIGEQEGQHYFSMKFVDGGSLSHKAGMGKPAEMAQIVATVARAVHHAHQRGILHRDLKPANILLDREGQPHVTDFGLAKKVEGDSGLTHSGAIVGTPSYMPPEQARGEKGLTVAADVYSLGAILYECLTGRPPFRASTSLDTLIQVLDTEPVAPRSFNTNIPHDLETISLKCLQKDPKRRYESALAVAEDLERWLRHEPIQARRTSWLGRAGRWCRRNPAVAGLLGALAVALVTGLIGVTFKWLEAESERQRAEEARDRAETNEQKAETNRLEAERHRQKAEANLYVSNLALADREMRALKLSQAATLLDTCPLGRRGWEWDYLSRALQEYHRRVVDHSTTVATLAFSPDRTRLASASYDETVKIWNTKDGKLVWTFSEHVGPVRAVAYSPDGKLVASGGYDRTVKLWNPETGDVRYTLKGMEGSVLALAFDPTGERLITVGNEKEVRVWDFKKETCERMLVGHDSFVSVIAVDSERQRFATGALDNRVILWDLKTGTMITSFPKLAQPVVGVTFSPDGKLLVAGTPMLIVGWDLDTGKERYSVEVQTPTAHADQLSRIIFHPDGKRLISSGKDKQLIVWNTESGKPTVERRFEEHTGQIRSLTISSHKLWLASGGSSKANRGEIKLWEVSGGVNGLKPILDFENSAAVQVSPSALECDSDASPTAWVFSPGCDYIAAAGKDDVLRVWDLTCSARAVHELRGHSKGVGRPAFSSDGKVLASIAPDGIRLWDMTTCKQTRFLKGGVANARDSRFSPDGQRLAVACLDQTARVWDVTTGALVAKLKGHINDVRRVVFSPDGIYLAAGASDGTVRVWRIGSGEEVAHFRCHQAVLYDVAFVPRRDVLRLATSSMDQTVRIWDALSGKEIAVCEGHIDSVQAFAFSPDGRRIVSGGLDKTLRVWDAETGQELLTLKEHEREILEVHFSSDGRRVISVDGGRVALRWDATPRK